jgi:hypothetical protein
MSQLARQLFDDIKQSIKDAPAEIGKEVKQQAAHGAHELAAALFNNSGFVMYPRGGKDDHGMHGPAQAPCIEEPAQHLERGGRGGM